MKQGGIFWTRDFFSLVHRFVLELIVELTSFMAVPEHSQTFFLSFCPYTASLVLLSITGKIPWQYFLPTDPCHRYYRCWCSITSVVSDSLWPHGRQPTRLLCPLDSPGKNTGVDRHSLLQGSSWPRDRTQVSCIAGKFFTIRAMPGKSHGRRSLVGCSPWGHEESDTTEWLQFHFSLSYIGEGNGNPLQCSCLENPRVGEAWWAAVYGVAQSQTRPKQLSSNSSITGYLSCSIWNNHFLPH